MLKGVNKVILIGVVRDEPVIRYTPANLQIVSFSVSTEYKKRSGDKSEESHNVILLDNFVRCEPIVIGSLVYIEGRIHYKKYVDICGADKNTTEIIIDEDGKIELVGGKVRTYNQQNPKGSNESYLQR